MTQQSHRQDRTVGVIGGMGPAATSYFLDLLIDRLPADEDQHHLRVVVDSNPKIPDRTGHLLDDGPDPLPLLVETAQNVESAGADILTMPCNTAHAFFDDLHDATQVPFLNMIELGADRAASIAESRVGLLATNGTIALGLYHDAVEDRGIELATPPEETQHGVMEALYEVKAGETETPRQRLVEVVDGLGDIDAVIAGCTEIPVVLSPNDIDVPFIDPMTVMADETIALAKRGSLPIKTA